MKALQTHLFKSLAELTYQPLIVAYGLGVDSTAALVEMRRRNIRPDAILFADTGSEKKETYDYLPVINSWLSSVGFPAVTIVKYQPVDFKNLPPYATLGENCLTNGTLPSLAFGFKSCSLKWKVEPQNKWTNQWPMAVDCWRSGGKVRKVIGYDASPKDMKRYAHARGMQDPKYDYWYPLIDWGMDRDACKRAITEAGLPVPPKSACVFCPATRPAELHGHRKEYLRYIVTMEARALPRLQGCMNQEQLEADYARRTQEWNMKLSTAKGRRFTEIMAKKPTLKSVGSGCAGLWRKSTKTRPAQMTDYIRANNLLSVEEILNLRSRAVIDIPRNQAAYQSGSADYLNWHDFLEMFSEEDALDELSRDCVGCAQSGV
jgi:hypothetical protein